MIFKIWASAGRGVGSNVDMSQSVTETSYARRVREFARNCPMALVGLASVALAGCASERAVTIPMAVVSDNANCAKPVDTLLVMLPGVYSRPEDFIREGFVAAVRERGVAADVLMVDAHLGYYKDKSIVQRLTLDIVAPALKRGYNHIWVLGISIGAFGAMILPALDSQDSSAQEVSASPFEGIVALGPYLGQPKISDEINAQGGLRSWHAPRGQLDPNDIDNVLWRWLQESAVGASSKTRPTLYLGYGRDDRFAFSDRLLAAALPADRVDTVPGGHDWGPWLALWRRVLPRLPLTVDASCTGSRP
jgi:hypothetical protein